METVMLCYLFYYQGSKAKIEFLAHKVDNDLFNDNLYTIEQINDHEIKEQNIPTEMNLMTTI